jgi:multidrug efflux pump subunit AcrA (membrane-fusion protein)
MENKRWFVGLPVVGTLIVGALAIGLVPSVRNAVSDAFPQLGINGPKLDTKVVAGTDSLKTDPATLATKPSESIQPLELPPRLVEIDTPTTPNTANFVQPIGTSRNDAQIVLAQSTQQGDPNGGSRRIANLDNTSQEVPPKRSGGTSGNSILNGSLIIRECQLQFPKDIEIAAQSEGIIMELFVEDGTLVKQKDVLVQLDSRIAMAEERVSKQELLTAKLKADDDSSVKFSKAAADVAKITMEISDNLLSDNAESEEDNRKKRLEYRKADLQITVSENEKKQHAAAVALQQAKLEATQVQVDLRKITAPWDGFISKVMKKQFSFVRPGEVICQITSMDSIRVVGLAEVDFPPHLLLNAPAKVRIQVPGIQAPPIVEGIVSYVSPKTESKNTFPIHVNIPNQKMADGQFYFRGGMVAEIEVMINR